MKNKNLYQSIFLQILFIVLLCACQKSHNVAANTPADNTSILSIIESYYAFSKTKVDGEFIFESNVANNDPAIENTALIGGVFYDRSGNAQTGGGTVSIGGRQLLPNSSGTYGFNQSLPRTGLYGTNVAFSLNPPQNDRRAASTGDSSSADTTVRGSIYSPLAINITNVPPRTPLVIQPNGTTTITWNADINNTNGVIIIAEYIPILYGNLATFSNGYNTFLTNSVLVPDNGSTNLPWSFFSQYPPGGQIILWVARGNYTILKSGEYNYKVGGYTASAVWDVVIPYPTIQGSFTASPGFTYESVPSGISSTGSNVSFQFIVQKNSTTTINYANQFQLGTISGSGCLPHNTTSFNITQQGGSLHTCIWNVTITTSGTVLLKLVSGTPNPAAPIALVKGAYNTN